MIMCIVTFSPSCFFLEECGRQKGAVAGSFLAEGEADGHRNGPMSKKLSASRVWSDVPVCRRLESL